MYFVKHAEVAAIFSKIKIYVWEHTELCSHRLKCVYFVSDIKTKASTSRTLQNFQSPVTNLISFDPTQSEKTGTGSHYSHFTGEKTDFSKGGESGCHRQWRNLSAFFCLRTILFVRIFKGCVFLHEYF